MAAICLHNYLRQTENALYCPTGFVDSEDSTGRLKPGEWRNIVASDNGCLQSMPNTRGSRYAVSAIEMRSAIRDFVNSSPGSVPWQLEHVRRTGEKE